MSRPARTNAKKEWDALDDDTDLAAVIEAAKAWQASWARQGRPDAPRKSAAVWLHDEFYLKPAPKGFQKLEKAGKLKADTKTGRGIGLDFRPLTIIDHRIEENPLGDFETFTFLAEDGTKFTERMHIYAGQDEGPDYYSKEWLESAAFGRGNPEGDFIGRVVLISEHVEGLEFRPMPEKGSPAAPPPVVRAVAPPPIITKKIISASAEKKDGERVLVVEFDDGSGDRIVIESYDREGQEEGQRRLAHLLNSAGIIDDVENAADLMGRTVRSQGNRYIPAHEDVDDTLAPAKGNEPPLPASPTPEPTRQSTQEETAADFAERMAKKFNTPSLPDDWIDDAA
jgi:hypothetical protein